MGDWNARGSRGRSLCVWRVSRGISEVLRRLQNGRIQKRKWFGNWNLFFFRNGRIRRRFEAKEPDKTLLFWSIFGDVFDARTRCERTPGVSRRRGRLESPRDEAQGPARASALFRNFLRSGTRRKILISISSKKSAIFQVGCYALTREMRAQRGGHIRLGRTRALY